jgi:2-methylcitrate dehydratase PrpD
MTLAEELAARIVAMRYDGLPAPAVQWSRVAFMDTIGVMLAGAGEDSTRIARGVMAGNGGDGPCSVVGTTRGAGCLDAALVNGTAAHALDFDNGSNSMGGHASATMVPALIAAVRLRGGSGRDLLLAHTVGFETGTRIGHGVNFHHYEKGWHPTSTLGTFAVAAACSSLLKLDRQQTAAALALAASLASGIKANFGTMTKPLHVGQCARNGLLAALLARDGFTANTEAFEHQHGFLNVFNGPGTYRVERILAGWGEPLEIVRPGAGYKEYPCCAATHAALDATFRLLREHGPIADGEIAQVRTWTPARRLAHTNRPDPKSNLDAKFSVQYCVSRALLDGKIIVGQFEGDAWRDRRTRALMQRVRSEVHRPGQFAADNHFGAEVEVTLLDGRTLTGRVDIQRGRTSDDPIPPDLLRAKFENCAARALGADQVRRLAQAIDTLDTAASVDRLAGLLAPAVAKRKAVQ